MEKERFDNKEVTEASAQKDAEKALQDDAAHQGHEDSLNSIDSFDGDTDKQDTPYDPEKRATETASEEKNKDPHEAHAQMLENINGIQSDERPDKRPELRTDEKTDAVVDSHQEHADRLSSIGSIGDDFEESKDKPAITDTNPDGSPKRFEDYTYSELLDMARDNPKLVTKLNEDFRERYEAETRDMSVEEYRDYKEKINIDNRENVLGLNDNPAKDIQKAFDLADKNYDKSSTHWQEVANRKFDNLIQQKANLDKLEPVVRDKMDDAYEKLVNYAQNNDINNSDSKYNSMLSEYEAAKSDYDNLTKQQYFCKIAIDYISADIDPERKTIFRGINGSDFNDSYNGFITESQGHAVPGFGGVCGINETCSIVNQQTGRTLNEAEGVRIYRDNGWCITDNNYACNGSTDADGRSKFLESQGLTFDRVDGKFGNKNTISLEAIASRFYNGESAGIILKAEDLYQPELSSRKFDFKASLADNRLRYYSNHATTIAGFSFDKNNKITGVWVNDTANEMKGNRIFIDADKFKLMQSQTKDFAVEFSKRR